MVVRYLPDTVWTSPDWVGNQENISNDLYFLCKLRMRKQAFELWRITHLYWRNRGSENLSKKPEEQ